MTVRSVWNSSLNAWYSKQPHTGRCRICFRTRDRACSSASSSWCGTTFGLVKTLTTHRSLAVAPAMVLVSGSAVAGRSAFGTTPVTHQPSIHSRCANGVSACGGLASVVSRCVPAYGLRVYSDGLVALWPSLLYACRRSQQEWILRRSSQRAARSVNCTRAEGWYSLMHAASVASRCGTCW